MAKKRIFKAGYFYPDGHFEDAMWFGDPEDPKISENSLVNEDLKVLKKKVEDHKDELLVLEHKLVRIPFQPDNILFYIRLSQVDD